MGKLIKLHILGDFLSSGPGFLGSASPREQEVLSLRKAIVSSSDFFIRGAAGVRRAQLPRWAEGWKSSTASSPDALSLARGSWSASLPGEALSDAAREQPRAGSAAPPRALPPRSRRQLRSRTPRSPGGERLALRAASGHVRKQQPHALQPAGG